MATVSTTGSVGVAGGVVTYPQVSTSQQFATSVKKTLGIVTSVNLGNGSLRFQVRVSYATSGYNYYISNLQTTMAFVRSGETSDSSLTSSNYYFQIKSANLLSLSGATNPSVNRYTARTLLRSVLSSGATIINYSNSNPARNMIDTNSGSVTYKQYTLRINYVYRLGPKDTEHSTYIDIRINTTFPSRKVTVSYNNNGLVGTWTPNTSPTYYQGKVTLARFTPTGKKTVSNSTPTVLGQGSTTYTAGFSFWTTAAYKSTNVNQIPSGYKYNNALANYPVTSNHTLYARGGFPAKTLTFNGNGSTSGSQGSVSYVIGNSYTLPTSTGFVKTGYKFTGWYDSAATTQKVTSWLSGASGKNDVAYAGWTPIKVTINFDKQSGTGGTDSVSWLYSDTTMPTATMPTRTDYVFKGYYTAKNGSGTKIVNENGSWVINTKSYTADTTLTIYALWQPDPRQKYNVTYNKGNAVSGYAPGAMIKIENENLTLATNSGNLAGLTTTTITNYEIKYALPSRTTAQLEQYGQAEINKSKDTFTTTTVTGQVFSGWNTKADGTGTTYAAGATYTGNADLTLYPKLTSGTTATTNKITLPPILNDTGRYEIWGWFTKQDPTSKTDGFIGNPGTQIEKTAIGTNTTLYAIVRLIRYTVTYKANGGTGADIVVSVVKNDVYNILSNSFTRNGFTQKSPWNTNSGGTGTNYTFGQSITITGNLTLYAKWEANPVPPDLVYVAWVVNKAGTWNACIAYIGQEGLERVARI